MATTRIMPLHAGKGRTVGKAISDIIDYVKNLDKTDHGRLITSYQCDSRVADAQFLLDKQTYAARTGRVRGKDDVIAYHLRQSFVPGEITPEEANRLGVELARRFTKGKHAFIVCTHIDKAHVHNHIIWNSTTLECDRKFRNFWGSTRAVHRLSDTICIENGYSIVDAPKRRGQSYNKWLGDAAKPSHKELLRQAIDRALAQKPASLEELLRLLEQDGFTVHRRGKTISISAEGWGNNVRFDRLGDGYTLDDLLAVLSGQKEHTLRKETAVQAAPPKVNLLVDIQDKLKAGKGAGYAHWAKVFNLKQMQCARPCHDTRYPSLELAEKLAAAEQDGRIPTELVPRCPKCGGPMDIHMGAGERMIPDTSARERFQNFLAAYHGKNLVVLELGVGWRNQLIKAPLMRLVANEPNATYVTINLGEVYIADNIKEKSFGLDGRLDELLPALRKACGI